MTLDEANTAVEKSMDELFDAVDAVLDSASVEFMDALQRLHDARDAHYDAIMVWGELDDAAKK